MAKQVGPIFLERTIGNIIFYKMDGNYYVRMKPSFPDIKRSPRFRGTMQSARRMGRASKIGAALYAALPEGLKQFDKYKALTGEAFRLLKWGKTDAEALEIIWLQQKDLVERGCAIAATVYDGLGASFRQLWMLWAFAEEAMEMIKAGKTDEDVLAVLWKTYAAEFETGYREEDTFRYKNRRRQSLRPVRGRAQGRLNTGQAKLREARTIRIYKYLYAGHGAVRNENQYSREGLSQRCRGAPGR